MQTIPKERKIAYFMQQMENINPAMEAASGLDLNCKCSPESARTLLQGADLMLETEFLRCFAVCQAVGMDYEQATRYLKLIAQTALVRIAICEGKTNPEETSHVH